MFIRPRVIAVICKDLQFNYGRILGFNQYRLQGIIKFIHTPRLQNIRGLNIDNYIYDNGISFWESKSMINVMEILEARGVIEYPYKNLTPRNNINT